MNMIIPYIPPTPLSGNQKIWAAIFVGVIVLLLLFFEDIVRWFRENFNFTITRTEHRVPSASNLPPPLHVLSHPDSETEPDENDLDDDESDEDELRIARNSRMAEMLRPFDRVLIRDDECDNWEPAFFAYFDDSDDDYPFYCTNNDHFAECIPYEGNEHLYLTNDDYAYEPLHPSAS